jgi:hypothetical protein
MNGPNDVLGSITGDAGEGRDCRWKSITPPLDGVYPKIL